ncbi:3-isopropylmalate/(R)-2-methylmalate dehydratase large subunit [Sporobacter termitidis DSM 10068]|uniref:3-isopropylmalate dehydratase large subunit n=1 Tax=Sporobacter termitidis DSM 10068 TaxID=1123282 RepID=A0A1M5Z3I3_9FIRM|nr:3-isopropylmalate dehydratase large subunit [Sporobacter termitidis]SHI18668.1 3-isopropylmalate/(R)-2-methylmalate dehydratase large subunit [Sporobacter termitidis DSM 10068]
MGMTITEKILARGCGAKEVHAGQIVNAKIDLAMTQDASGPIAFNEFRELGIPVWDKKKIFVCIDHFAPPTTLAQADTLKINADFARDYEIEHFFNIRGISHQLICEGGHIRPGMVAVGADSHTTTYGALGAFSTGIGSTEMCSVFATGELWFRVPEAIKVVVSGKLPEHVYSKDIILKLLSMIQANGATYKTLEFCGDTIADLSVEARLTLCNMSVEGGAKNAIIAPDEKTITYLEARGIKRGDMDLFQSDSDAKYIQEIRIDASELVPYVAKPHSPANGVPVGEVEGVPLQQVIIGSCTNGRTEDFKIAAGILRGHTVPRDLKCLITPASNQVIAELSQKGYLQVFADAGCIICNAGCNGCGIHALVNDGENCLSTNNRNYLGRMGSAKGSVYLSSPATAAASAISGKITDPRSR